MLLSQEHFRCGFRGWAQATMVALLFVTCMRAAEPVRVWRAVPAKPYGLPGVERRLLNRAVRFIENRQWDDAIDAITQLLESETPNVVEIEENRFVGLREQCHRLLSQLPKEPLAKYRMLVDPAVESWYRQGMVERDTTLLQRVVGHHFCSSWGDEAAFALGEIALQRGEYQQARNAWERLDASKGSTHYPDSNLPQAAVRARLALLSIREGDWRSAEQELERLKADFPQAKGQFGGREVLYAGYLAQLLKEAKNWSPLPESAEWWTFAANSRRTNSHRSQSEIGPWELVWTQPIANEELSIFPIVVNDQVIYQDDSTVYARRLPDGEEMFRAEGEDFQSPKAITGLLGTSCHTLTTDGRYVFGVTRSALGRSRRSSGFHQRSRLWGLDLQRGGSLVVSQPSQNATVSFAGAPIVHGTNVIVPICSNDQTARMGIACFDLEVNQWRWQRWLGQANTPATGRAPEIAGNLLTYDAGVIYANTNLGAVAAVRADDGQVLWLRTYERKSIEVNGDGSCAYYRAAAPCMFHQGKVYVLPADGKSLLALEASTGQLQWHYPIEDPTAQLIGVTDTRVVLVNGGLEVLERETGALAGGNEIGRLEGWPAVRLRAGHSAVYFPRADSKDLFFNTYDLKDAGVHFDGYRVADKSGANLLLAGNVLIAAGRTKLSVLRYQSRSTSDRTDLQSSLKE